MTDDSLEQALTDLAGAADATVRGLTAALKEAKRAKAAASSGQLRELRLSLEATARLADQAASTADRLEAGWTF